MGSQIWSCDICVILCYRRVNIDSLADCIISGIRNLPYVCLYPLFHQWVACVSNWSLHTSYLLAIECFFQGSTILLKHTKYLWMTTKFQSTKRIHISSYSVSCPFSIIFFIWPLSIIFWRFLPDSLSPQTRVRLWVYLFIAPVLFCFPFIAPILIGWLIDKYFFLVRLQTDALPKLLIYALLILYPQRH